MFGMTFVRREFRIGDDRKSRKVISFEFLCSSDTLLIALLIETHIGINKRGNFIDHRRTKIQFTTQMNSNKFLNANMRRSYQEVN